MECVYIECNQLIKSDLDYRASRKLNGQLAVFKLDIVRLDSDFLGIIESIAGMNVLGEDMCLNFLSIEITDIAAELGIVVDGAVCESYSHNAVLYGSGRRYHRNALATAAVLVIGMAVYALSILMSLEHIENVVCRSLDKLFALSEDYSLKNVDNLSDISHNNALAVTVEDIQLHSCNDSITHGVLLIKESGICAGFNIEPVAPLVHDKTYLVIGVVAVHYLGMSGQHNINVVSEVEYGIVIVGIKLCGRALVYPVGNVVCVEGYALCLVGIEVLHQHLCPVVPILSAASGTAGYLEELVAAVIFAVAPESKLFKSSE